MCLTRVNSKRFTTDEDLVVYKVFVTSYKNRNKIRNLFRSQSKFVPVGILRKARVLKMFLEGDLKNTYMSGFHCFLNAQEAVNYAAAGYDVIIPCTIPKGSKVQYGYQDNIGMLIVSNQVIVQEEGWYYK
jgi:hypothetical protein